MEKKDQKNQPPPPNQPQRSSLPKTLGILSMIFGGLVLLGSVASLLVGILMNVVVRLQATSGGDSARLGGMLVHMRALYGAVGILGGVTIIPSAILMIVGRGLYQYKPWAIDWARYWSIGALCLIPVLVVLSFVLLGPAYGELFRALPRVSQAGRELARVNPQTLGRLMGGLSGAGYLLIYSPFPIILLVYGRNPALQQVSGQRRI